MSRFFSLRRIALALVALAVLGLALPAPADDDLPFRGRADEVVTGVELVPGGLQLTADGVGEATHLGRFTRHAVGVVHADGTVTGTVVFTAANGDQLYADLDGAFTSLTSIEGTYTFTGGTGRFEDASGDADFVAVTSDLIHIAVTFEGSIEY